MHLTQRDIMRPVVGVATLYIRLEEGTMLLAERLKGKCRGFMNCPGGHLEWGESFEQCAIRESKEEADITLKRVEFLTAANGLKLDENHHYVMIYMLAKEWEGEARQMEDANGPWDWYKIPGPEGRMLPTTLIALCRYLELRRQLQE